MITTNVDETYDALLSQLREGETLAQLTTVVSRLTLNADCDAVVMRDVQRAVVFDFENYEATANRDEKRKFALTNTPFHVMYDTVIVWALSFLAFDMIAIASCISKRFNGMYTVFGKG